MKLVDANGVSVIGRTVTACATADEILPAYVASPLYLACRLFAPEGIRHPEIERLPAAFPLHCRR